MHQIEFSIELKNYSKVAADFIYIAVLSANKHKFKVNYLTVNVFANYSILVV